MKNKKKMISLLLAGVMALSLAACGGGQTGEGGGKTDEAPASSSEISTAVASGKIVYTDSEIAIEELEAKNYVYEISYMAAFGDEIRGYGFYYDPADGSQVDFLCSFKSDGSDMKITPLDLVYDGYNTYYSNYVMDSEGGIYFIKQTMGDMEGEEEIEEMTEEEEYDYFLDAEETFSLIRADENGKVLWSSDIDFGEEDSEYAFPAVYGLAWSDRAGLYVSTSVGILRYDPQNGDLLGTLEGTEGMSECQMHVMADGNLLLIYNNGEGYEYTLVDAENGGTSEIEVSPDVRIDYNFSLYPGRNSDLLLADSNGIYTYNFGDNAMVEIVNFIGTEMDVSFVGSMVEMEDGKIALMVMEATSGLQKLHILTPVDSSTVKERKELKLSCYYMDANARRVIINFNKTNEEYKIIVNDYSKFDDVSSVDYASASQGAAQFNTDIISGNVPDIVILSGDMFPENYISKGIFEDMAPYLEKDPELSGKEYLTNIFDAVNPWGGLYVLSPSFTLAAMLGKEEYIGDGIDLDQLIRLADQKGIEYKDIFTFELRNAILYNAMMLNGSEFIDLSSGKCRFDSEEFINLLEFTNKLPADYSEETEDDYGAYESYYRDDRALLAMSYLYSFDSYKEAVQATFGTDVSITGFPSAAKSTASVYPELRICMSSTSSEKEGAWQFIRSFLTDEYQESIYNNEMSTAFPVSVPALEAMAKASTEQQYYTDEFGLEQPENPLVTVGGVDIELVPLEKKEAQKLVDVLKSVDHTAYTNYEVMDIVIEEAESYWNGEKSSREVADIIQSRISIFINENS
jgi:ABC-type glycerol-3-phosphate transport system substrate-binding protein